MNRNSSNLAKSHTFSENIKSENRNLTKYIDILIKLDIAGEKIDCVLQFLQGKNISILKTKGQASLCLDYWLLPVIACYGKTGCDVERRSTKTFWLNISAPNYQI